MQVAEKIVESDEVIGGEDIVHPLLIHTLSPYIRQDFTREDVQRFIKDLHKNVPYKIGEDEDMVEIWSKKLRAITKPYDFWRETTEADERTQCSEISFNLYEIPA